MNIKIFLKKTGWLFAGLFLCLPGQASPNGSRIAQERFNQQLLELLKADKLDEVQALRQSVPDCPAVGEPAPAFCTQDRTDQRSFLQHVWSKGALTGKMDFDIVMIDAGLYDSLGTLYRTRYKSSNTQFQLDNYRRFYAKYKGTWLQPYVERILTQLWQPGAEFKKYEGFSGMKGENVYNTLYISALLGFDSMYKHISPEIRLDKSLVGGGRRMLRDILNGMNQRSVETNSPEILRAVKRSWLHSILLPEYDDAEKNYYGGKKLQRMFELLDEEGWGMFVDPGMQPTDWEKHTVQVYVRACPRLHREEVCTAFEKGATRYGYYIAPIEHTEPTPQEIIEGINIALQEKLRGL